MTAQTADVEFYDARWRDRQGELLRGIRLKRVAAIISEVSKLDQVDPDIIELGCGFGTLSGMLRLVGNVTGIDQSPVAIEQAKVSFPGVKFLAGDLFDAPLPRKTFNLVVSQEVIEHVDDQAKFVELCHSLLRPRGYMILTTPNATIFHLSGKFETARNKGLLQPKENLLTVSQLRKLVRPEFEIIGCSTIAPGGHRGALRVVNSPKLCRFKLWRALRSALPFGLHTVIVARAK